MFKNAIVRTPCSKVTEGISSSPELGKPDYGEALKEHKAYIEALRLCGLDVRVLPPDEDYPDSCFVEDTAVLTGRCAVITNPGAVSRNGEILSMIPVIREFYPDSCIEYISAPGTLEGGDVMMAGDTFYVGRSLRTNSEGIAQFRDILGKYGYKVIEVPLKKVLHLKTGVNYLEHNNMLVSGEFVNDPLFSSYRRYEIPEDEAYAANSLFINDRVLVPAGFPRTLELIGSLGYETISVDTSQFRKIDGGLSCLSLRFTSLK